MRVLLDECVPRALRTELPGHEVKTVDRQNFSALALAVIVMDAPSNDIVVLRPLMPAVLEAIPKAQSGVVTHIHR